MSDDSAEKHRNGRGEHDSVSVLLIAEDEIRKGKSSTDVLYGGGNMNGATLGGVVDIMNARQGQSGT